MLLLALVCLMVMVIACGMVAWGIYHLVCRIIEWKAIDRDSIKRPKPATIFTKIHTATARNRFGSLKVSRNRIK